MKKLSNVKPPLPPPPIIIDRIFKNLATVRLQSPNLYSFVNKYLPYSIIGW